MALRASRRSHRHQANIRGIHRLVLIGGSTSPDVAAAPRVNSVLGGVRPDEAALPFSPETSRRLRVALMRISTRSDSSEAVSAVLRQACHDSQGVSPDRMVSGLHAIWRGIRPAHERCPEAVQNRYRAVVAEILSFRFGEELVGLP
jgi:hypothetical protein